MRRKRLIWMAWMLMLCSLILGGSVWAQESKPPLTIKDVIRLSEKGEELTPEDFAGYAGTIYGTTNVRYEIEGGYRMEMILGSNSVMRLYYKNIAQCAIDIRYFDVREFVNSEDKSQYVFYSKKLKLEDLIRLSEMGNDLRYEHFMHYSDVPSYLEDANEGEVCYISEFTPLDGYILHIGEDEMIGSLVRAWLIKKDAKEHYIDIREGDVMAFIESTQNIAQKPQMTMEDLIRISKKGKRISWDDLKAYEGDYHIDFSISAEYSVGEMYRLKVYGDDWNNAPYSVYLIPNGVYSPYYIDVRVESVEEFINSENKSKYALGGQRISRDDVRMLAAQGDALICNSFERYCMDSKSYRKFGYEGEGDAVYQFVIDDIFSLLVGEYLPSRELAFVRLMLNAAPETYIDIRTENVDAFFEKYDSDKNQHTGKLTIDDVRSIQRLGRLLSAESFEKYGAKNIGTEFYVYRYEVGNSYYLQVNICNTKEIGTTRQAYLISREDEDDFVNIWQSSEDVLNRLK